MQRVTQRRAYWLNITRAMIFDYGWIRFAYFVVTLLMCGQSMLQQSFSVGVGVLTASALCFFSTATFVGSFRARREHKYRPTELAGIAAIALILCVGGLALMLWSGYRITLFSVRLSGFEWSIVGIIIALLTTTKRDAAAGMPGAPRMGAFPVELEKRLSMCSPEQRATSLVCALEYCLKLRRSSDSSGSIMSMALLEPDNLTAPDCQSLYSHLEGVYSKFRTMRVSGVDLKTITDRHGKESAQDYKASVEDSARLSAIGVGVLMTRLSYRLGRLQAVVNALHEPASPYTRVGSMLRECIPHVSEATRYASRVRPTSDVWSDETVSFVENSARIIAMTYPG
ncbi:MAG: hypothetical protein ACRDHZ_14970 [Ktedonobacteraceae bacterium]